MSNMRETKVCPRCGKSYNKYPSLSRRDNETDICPACGTLEAMEDYLQKGYTGKVYWNERIIQ